MSEEFMLEILTPGRELLSAKVTEVVLPAFDGERGILSGHADLIGLLGTGPVKIVRDGDDYWFLVSSGVYQVKDGNVTLFAELAEDAAEIDALAAKERLSEIEAAFNDHSRFTPADYPAHKLAHDRNQARLEVHRRTNVVQ